MMNKVNFLLVIFAVVFVLVLSGCEEFSGEAFKVVRTYKCESYKKDFCEGSAAVHSERDAACNVKRSETECEIGCYKGVCVNSSAEWSAIASRSGVLKRGSDESNSGGNAGGNSVSAKDMPNNQNQMSSEELANRNNQQQGGSIGNTGGSGVSYNQEQKGDSKPASMIIRPDSGEAPEPAGGENFGDYSSISYCVSTFGAGYVCDTDITDVDATCKGEVIEAQNTHTCNEKIGPREFIGSCKMCVENENPKQVGPSVNPKPVPPDVDYRNSPVESGGILNSPSGHPEYNFQACSVGYSCYASASSCSNGVYMTEPGNVCDAQGSLGSCYDCYDSCSSGYVCSLTKCTGGYTKQSEPSKVCTIGGQDSECGKCVAQSPAASSSASISAISNNEYKTDVLAAGKPVYVDEDSFFFYLDSRDGALSDGLKLYENLTYIKTANADRTDSDLSWSFKMGSRGYVYVAHEPDTNMPFWLSEFIATNDYIKEYTEDGTFHYLRVYKKLFLSGQKVTLGVNRRGLNLPQMYIVIIGKASSSPVSGRLVDDLGFTDCVAKFGSKAVCVSSEVEFNDKCYGQGYYSIANPVCIDKHGANGVCAVCS